MKFDIYFLEIDLLHYLYGLYKYINSFFFILSFFEKFFCQFTNGLVFESRIWETASSIVSLAHNHY